MRCSALGPIHEALYQIGLCGLHIRLRAGNDQMMAAHGHRQATARGCSFGCAVLAAGCFAATLVTFVRGFHSRGEFVLTVVFALAFFLAVTALVGDHGKPRHWAEADEGGVRWTDVTGFHYVAFSDLAGADVHRTLFGGIQLELVEKKGHRISLGAPRDALLSVVLEGIERGKVDPELPAELGRQPGESIVQWLERVHERARDTSYRSQAFDFGLLERVAASKGADPEARAAALVALLAIPDRRAGAGKLMNSLSPPLMVFAARLAAGSELVSDQQVREAVAYLPPILSAGSEAMVQRR